MEDINNNAKVSQNQGSKEYNFGIDLIRILAMFFVILVHSTTFYGFTTDSMGTLTFISAGTGRYLSYTCVPLFIVLTGYLNYNKTPSLKYYLKIFKFLLEFCICGIIVFLFNRIYFGDTTSILILLKKMITYTYPSYSWYMNMFVGLFLLTPFLNYGYKAIPDKYKWWFFVILILIFTNIYISSYWLSAYPLMYYLIGCLIKDKQLKIKKIYLLLSIFVVLIIQLLLAAYPTSLLLSVESYNNIGCVIITVAIFLLFYDLKTSKINKSKNLLFKTIRTISNASLATYLISEIFDLLNYRLFDKWGLTTFTEKYTHLLYLTPLKFLLSIICGIAINVIATNLYKLFIKIISKNKKINSLLNN